jgi:hypothetical protein
MTSTDFYQVTKSYYKGEEVITYKDLAELLEVGVTTTRVWLHSNRHALERPEPLLTVGEKSKRYYSKETILEWVEPLLEQYLDNRERGVGRPSRGA